MNKVNTLVISKDNHNTIEDYNNAIKDAIILLTENSYICTVFREERGITIIKYESARQEFGNPFPYWLTPDEVGLLQLAIMNEDK